MCKENELKAEEMEQVSGGYIVVPPIKAPQDGGLNATDIQSGDLTMVNTKPIIREVSNMTIPCKDKKKDTFNIYAL